LDSGTKTSTLQHSAGRPEIAVATSAKAEVVTEAAEEEAEGSAASAEMSALLLPAAKRYEVADLVADLVADPNCTLDVMCLRLPWS
jgi:hypothetical protein